MSPSQVGSIIIPQIIELRIYAVGKQPGTAKEKKFRMDDVQGVSVFFPCSLPGKHH